MSLDIVVQASKSAVQSDGACLQRALVFLLSGPCADDDENAWDKSIAAVVDDRLLQRMALSHNKASQRFGMNRTLTLCAKVGTCCYA
jgi:hypothetical protein